MLRTVRTEDGEVRVQAAICGTAVMLSLYGPKGGFQGGVTLRSGVTDCLNCCAGGLQRRRLASASPWPCMGSWPRAAWRSR